jgi:hypothetical protein
MSNIQKYLLALAAGVSTMAIISSAQASNYPLGAISPGGGQVVENVGTGQFTDTYSFFVNNNSSVGGEVDNLPLSLTFRGLTAQILNILNLNLALDGPSGSLASAAAGSSLNYANLLSDTPYTFVVSGTGTGQAGGTYAIAYNVSPVPLPAALPLLGAGLLSLGGFAWNKRREAKTA